MLSADIVLYEYLEINDCINYFLSILLKRQKNVNKTNKQNNSQAKLIEIVEN